ncbi:hypothetical protein FE782_26730 [Paenibacillus antri]|uniref:Glycoside hydrolase family 42 N-terminal domain-containing protein n=2 Tax=Paenibacillus antri TaxID=2582848 RepID=A0A5R9GCX0_9BACL|nr:hypothetical protein FE782_26730 [Paenibacillus antri]
MDDRRRRVRAARERSGGHAGRRRPAERRDARVRPDGRRRHRGFVRDRAFGRGGGGMKLGVAYDPEHESPDAWPVDYRKLKDAGIRYIRIAEFAWAARRPGGSAAGS